MGTLCSLMLSMGFTACLEDDLEQPELPIEPETYPAYILNEGLWGANNANITRFYPQYKIDNLSDFYQEMNGTKMGDVANAMMKEDDNIFVVLNGSKYVARLDLLCMEQVAIKGCPHDATQEVREICDFVAESDGGRGAVREFIEWMRKTKNRKISV